MENRDTDLMKSYVWHNDKCFYICTIDRDSSASQGIRFAETLVWEYDWDVKELGDMIYQASDFQGSITVHTLICAVVHSTGKPPEDDQ